MLGAEKRMEHLQTRREKLETLLYYVRLGKTLKEAGELMQVSRIRPAKYIFHISLGGINFVPAYSYEAIVL